MEITIEITGNGFTVIDRGEVFFVSPMYVEALNYAAAIKKNFSTHLGIDVPLSINCFGETLNEIDQHKKTRKICKLAFVW